MRIDGPSRTNTVGGPGGARRAGAPSAFTLPDEGVASRPVSVPTASAAYDVAALMALQSVEGPVERRRKAVKRGFELLDTLDGIRLDLLTGDVDPDKLARLMETLAGRAESDDPRIEALVADIELRARVELAKRGRYAD